MKFADTTERTRLREQARPALADDGCVFRASLPQLLAVPPAVVKDGYGVDVGGRFQVVGEAASSEDPVRIVKVFCANVLLPLNTIPLAGCIIRTHLVIAIHLEVRRRTPGVPPPPTTFG